MVTLETISKRVLQYVAVRCSALQCVAIVHSVLQCVACVDTQEKTLNKCCSVLQCVAVLQRVDIQRRF